MLWREMGDTLFLAASAAPAFMLQVMHPTIAAGVDGHSVFRSDPYGRMVRSADSVMLWIYGGEEALAEGRRLRALHRRIRGVGADGNRYSALDPEAYAWVHGTAFVSAVSAYPLARGRALTAREQERLYAEVLELGRVLRVPARMMPRTVAGYWDYYRTMVSERLRRTSVAVELLGMVSAPPPLLLRGPLAGLAPLSWPTRRAVGELPRLLLIAGMTPDARAVLGVDLTGAQERALRSWMALVRALHARLPERFRYMPLALHAIGYARELEQIAARARLP
jgi:uncharacterized protein (DUF2236 family)